MKLSMWMIANRLSSFDMDLAIKDDAEVCLYSARLAYATNCVYIHESGKGIVCEHNGSSITLYNINITQAFEIIQGIFDFYEDWLEKSIQAVKSSDYQALVDNCYSVLSNPMVMLDGNCKLLGMSSGYAAKDMDKEWKHLAEYGYSSLNAIQAFKTDCRALDFQHHGEQSFAKLNQSCVGFSGLSYCLQYDSIMCGRITLLEKERQINNGDLQIIQLLANILEPALSYSMGRSHNKSNNCLYNLLLGHSYSDSDLDIQLNYSGWKRDDNFQVTALKLGAEFFDENNLSLNIFHQLLQTRLTDCMIVRKNPFIFILSHHDLSADSSFDGIIKAAPKNFSIRIGHSLYSPGVKNANALLSQAKAALEYGQAFNPKKTVFHFIDYAVNFMLHNTSFSDCIASCHPAIVALHHAKLLNNDELFDTLKFYLDYERSVSQTAAQLFTHKNTVIYRIKKIRGLIPEDFDDPNVRNYLRTSINVMELSEKVSA